MLIALCRLTTATVTAAAAVVDAALLYALSLSESTRFSPPTPTQPFSKQVYFVRAPELAIVSHYTLRRYPGRASAGEFYSSRGSNETQSRRRWPV
jgi:hypothetical protein